MVRGVGVDALLDGPGRHAHRLAADGRLEGLEVPVVDGARAYERFDLGNDLAFERRFEPPFLTASGEVAWGAASLASHNRSLVSTNSRTKPRNRWYSAICRRVALTACGGMMRVTVLPPTAWVSDQLGP